MTSCRNRVAIVIGSRSSSTFCQKVIHHHEFAQAVTEDRQSMQLQAKKLQPDMKRNEKFVSEAWEALRAAEEQRHSEAPHRHAEEAASAVLKSQNDVETHTSATEPNEILSVNHRNDGEKSSVGRSFVAAARSTLEGRPEAVYVAVQAEKTDAELRLRVDSAEVRISALELKVSER